MTPIEPTACGWSHGMAALAGLGFGHRDARAWRRKPEACRVASLIQHAAARDDQRTLRLGEQVDGAGELVGIGGGPSDAVRSAGAKKLSG